LSRASLVERIKHAAWTGASSWLLLLLRTDVDAPPDWVRDINVLVGNVSNFTRACISWISFDINGFQRSGEFDVSEHDVSNTAMLEVGRNRADAHSDTQVDVRVLDEDVLCAVDTFTCMARFWNNSIIIISNINISEGSVSSSHIDTISVQWENRHREMKSVFEDGWEVEESEWLEHTHVACDDFKVMHVDVLAVCWHNMERGRVVDFDSADFDSFCGSNLDELWSMSKIQAEEFSNPPHEALAVDLTAS